MPDELKPVLARQMEVYAGFLEHTDHHVGRMIDAIEDLGVLDNTIVYYIIGDNGASAEGTMNGAFNEMANFNGMAALETPEFMVCKMDELGSPESYNHYSVGWALAMCTPVPVDQAGRLALGRHPQRHDRALAERHRGEGWAALAVHPRDRPRADDPRGRRSARADHGQRRACSRPWRAPACSTPSTRPVPERHDLQYFEMFGNRGIYYKGWSAVTKHRTPWVMVGATTPGIRRRRLGAVRRQQRLQPGPQPCRRAPRHAGQAAAALAHRGDEVQRAAHRRPRRRAARSPRSPAGPTLIRGNSQQFFPGMGRLSENSVVSIKNKSFSVTAEVEIPEGGAEGVIIAQGGRFGGWSRLRQGRQGQVRLQRARHPGVRHRGRLADPGGHPPGAHGVRLRRRRTGKGGDVTLYYDGDAVGTGRVEATQAMIFSADETTDIGYESGTTVTPDYTAAHQPVHRHDQLGADRPGHRRPRPLHRPRGTPPDRHGAAVDPGAG